MRWQMEMLSKLISKCCFILSQVHRSCYYVLSIRHFLVVYLLFGFSQPESDQKHNECFQILHFQVYNFQETFQLQSLGGQLSLMIANSFLKLTRLFIRPPPLALRPLSLMSNLKQQVQSIKVKKPTSKTDIISLLSEELQQLSTIGNYGTSVAFLEKNQIQKSYSHLQFALTEAKAKYTESINLHLFLLNRMNILQKILGLQDKFLSTLEQIFFMCLSLKGDKSLQTLKHLHNYMIALVIQDPQKLQSLFDFLSESNMKILLKKSEYFKGISKFYCGDKQQAIKAIEQSSVQTDKKYLKSNNLSWLKLLMISNQTLEVFPLEKQQELKQIIKDLIGALVEAEKAGDLTTSSAEIQRNVKMTQMLAAYAQDSRKVVLLKIKSKTVLLNNQSHIIMMNMAHAFYLLKKNEQASLFMRIALQSAIQLQEPYRLGLGLVLLSKVNHRLKLEWQPTLVDILEHKNVYSPAVIKECLLTYSRFLFLQQRFYEAEAYVFQAENVKNTNLYVEGLVLPDYDFSF